MAKYRIVYTKVDYADVVVEANDPYEAREIADSIFDPKKHYVGCGDYEYSDYEEVEETAEVD